MRKLVLLCFFIAAFANPVSADSEQQYSLITASFSYHLFPPGDHHEYFSNRLVAVTRDTDIIPYMDRLILGTLSNSSGNQCLMLGAGRDWKKIDQKIKFVSVYAYVGEFAADSFAECADDGIYQDIDNIVGLGFAPYIYHGINYNLVHELSINGGLILPGVVSFTLEYSF